MMPRLDSKRAYPDLDMPHTRARDDRALGKVERGEDIGVSSFDLYM
jgi:hypothetical protein